MSSAPITAAAPVRSGMIVAIALDFATVRALGLVVVHRILRIGVSVKGRNQRHQQLHSLEVLAHDHTSGLY